MDENESMASAGQVDTVVGLTLYGGSPTHSTLTQARMPADDGYFYIKPDDINTARDGGTTFKFKIMAWADGYDYAESDHVGTAYLISELLYLYVVCGPDSTVVTPPSNFVTTQSIDVSSSDSFTFSAFVSSNSNCPVTTYAILTSDTDSTYPTEIASDNPTLSIGVYSIKPADMTVTGMYSFYIHARTDAMVTMIDLD